MKLSVIMPVYCCAEYLRRSLDAVLGQSLRDMEVICVDDGSTDGSAAILAEYAAKDGRVMTISQANAGLGAARNRGLAVASGEFVHFMDADDGLSGPDVYESLVCEMERKSLDAMLFDAETRFDSGDGRLRDIIDPSAYIRTRDYSTVRTGRDMLVDMYWRRDYATSPCLMVLRRRLLSSSGIAFPEGIIYEDNIFTLRVMLAADRVAHCPVRAYLRYVHENSIMTRPMEIRNLKSCLVCWRQGRELLMAQEKSPRAVRKVLSDITARFKWRVRHVARILSESGKAVDGQLEPEEASYFRQAMSCPLPEKIGDGIRCLKDRGLLYAFRRLFRALVWRPTHPRA